MLHNDIDGCYDLWWVGDHAADLQQPVVVGYPIVLHYDAQRQAWWVLLNDGHNYPIFLSCMTKRSWLLSLHAARAVCMLANQTSKTYDGIMLAYWYLPGRPGSYA